MENEIDDLIEDALDTFDHDAIDPPICFGLRHRRTGLLLATIPTSLVVSLPSTHLETCLLKYTMTPPHEVAPGLRCLRLFKQDERWLTIDCTVWIILFQRRWRQRRVRRFARRLFYRECTGRW